MLKYAFAGAFAITVATPVMAAETMYYVVRDGSKDCTVTDTAPSDWGTAKALGEYKTKAEAQKNLKVVCGKEAPKKAE